MKKCWLVLALGVLWFNSYAQDIAVEKEEVFKEVKSLVVAADFCTLKLISHDKNDVSFKGVIKSQENLEDYKFQISKNEGVLSITVLKPEAWKSHWGEVILMLPAGVSVDANTLSGKVEAEALKGVSLNVVSKSGHVILNSFEGTATVNSPAGDLRISNFSGELKGKTKTGTVDINGLKGNCDITCLKGLINISGVNGKLYVDGGTGNQEVENVEGDITLRSTSGTAKLSVAKGNISCKTFDGDMKLFNTNGVYNVQTSTGNIVGTRVGFATSSSFLTTEGNIKVQVDTKSNIAFELKSTNSYLRAMGKSKKKSLKVGKGDIIITGTSTTGSQAYY